MIASMVLAAAMATAVAPPAYHAYTVSVAGEYATLTLPEAPASVRLTSEPMAEGTLCAGNCGEKFASPLNPAGDPEWCAAWLVTWKDGATTAPSVCTEDTAAPPAPAPAPAPTAAPTKAPAPTVTAPAVTGTVPTPTATTATPAATAPAPTVTAAPTAKASQPAQPGTPTDKQLAVTGAPDVSALLLVGGGLVASGTALTATRKGRRK